jgi:hypothetical protein
MMFLVDHAKQQVREGVMSEGRKLNFLEKAMRIIPGYKGYKGKEERRDNDALFRAMLAVRLEGLSATATSGLASLKGPGALTTAGGFDRLTKKLELAADKVRFASRGYRGWFDMHKVQEEELDKLYEFDCSLTEDVEKLQIDFESLGSAVESATGVKESLEVAIAGLDNFIHKLEGRSALMVDLQNNTPID